MATGTIELPPASAVLPDGSTSNTAPQFQRTKSTAAAPAAHFIELLFDAATQEGCFWAVRLPTDYASSPVLKVQWKANAIVNSVVWGARMYAVTPADVDTPNEHALSTAQTVTTAVNATEARRLIESSITITNTDTMAAGDFLIIYLYRDAANASDTCTVDAEVVMVALEYTTI